MNLTPLLCALLVGCSTITSYDPILYDRLVVLSISIDLAKSKCSTLTVDDARNLAVQSNIIRLHTKYSAEQPISAAVDVVADNLNQFSSAYLLTPSTTYCTIKLQAAHQAVESMLSVVGGKHL